MLISQCKCESRHTLNVIITLFSSTYSGIGRLCKDEDEDEDCESAPLSSCKALRLWARDRLRLEEELDREAEDEDAASSPLPRPPPAPPVPRLASAMSVLSASDHSPVVPHRALSWGCGARRAARKGI